jgi:hypothetical protein
LVKAVPGLSSPPRLPSLHENAFGLNESLKTLLGGTTRSRRAQLSFFDFWMGFSVDNSEVSSPLGFCRYTRVSQKVFEVKSYYHFLYALQDKVPFFARCGIKVACLTFTKKLQRYKWGGITLHELQAFVSAATLSRDLSE